MSDKAVLRNGCVLVDTSAAWVERLTLSAEHIP
jgi:hypothetical protein